MPTICNPKIDNNFNKIVEKWIRLRTMFITILETNNHD